MIICFDGIFADNGCPHADICTFFDNNRIMTLVPSMACEIDAIGYCYIISYGQQLVTHIVQIAAHPDKHTFPDFKPTHAIQQNANFVKNAIGSDYLRYPFPDWFEQIREQ
jgi:hypothetical protein